MKKVEPALFNQVVNFLMPHMQDTEERRALVEQALYGSPVLSQIRWDGPAHAFTVALVRRLIDFGETAPGQSALAAVLDAIKALLGVDQQKQADHLIAQIKAPSPASTPVKIKPPDTKLDQDLYVFISYARPNQAIAEQVETYLTAAGVRVFRDAKDIDKGDNWDLVIERALQEANRMVLLLSSASMPYRKEVHREWFYFDQIGKTIYPLYLEDCQLHSRLYAYNYIDARTDLQAALDDLLLALGRDTPPPPAIASADRIMVFDEDVVVSRTLPEAFEALRQAVIDPDGSVALSEPQINDIVRHKPTSLTEYHLGRIAEWSRPRYALDNRFVYLTLLIDRGETEQSDRWAAPPEARSYHDLREVLAERPDDAAFVLLGDPGSGKSTLLRRLQLDDAIDRMRDGRERISFFISLNHYYASAGGEPPPPRQWLADEWQRRYPDLPPLDDFLAQGRVLLLLDALNEMPHRSPQEYRQRSEGWQRFLHEMVQTHPDNRALFSCRSLDYSASLSSKDLRVPQIVVQPLSPEQVREFLQVYLPEMAEMIWAELRYTPQFDLFRAPYFLKLLIDQVEATRAVPQGKAMLFTEFARQALFREISARNSLFDPDTLLTERDHQKLNLRRWRSPHDLPEHGVLFPALSKLAFQMQAQGIETEGALVRIDYGDACDLLDHDRHEDILKAGVALSVLDEDVGRYEILFFHQLLQEYFAARELAEHPDPERVRVEWHVDRVAEKLDDTLARLADGDPLPPLPATGWEETTGLAVAMSRDQEAAVRALMEPNLPLAARCAAAPDVSVSESLKSTIRQALIERTRNPEADLRARIAAGLALGHLGDPRFERKSGPHGDYLLPPMVDIPAGEYPIGDDASEYDDEKLAHTVPLAAFQIGQFPVTNAEYALFMAVGGYDDEQWWDTEAAKAWLRGEGTAEGPKQQWRDNRKTFQSMSEEYIQGLVTQNRITSKQAEDWITIRNWTDERFEQQLDEWYPSGKIYREPEFWNDTRFNNPTQPVVGVTWFEARAYCKWLSAQTRTTFELPTEAQVEAAARGKDGRLYSYGLEFDVNRSNTFESHIRQTTPVGIFDNAAPEGAFDLSGNVNTWTLSIYDQEHFPYPYRADDGREDLNETNVRRVVRGGSWGVSRDFARAVARIRLSPGGRSLNFGFRVVCVPHRHDRRTGTEPESSLRQRAAP